MIKWFGTNIEKEGPGVPEDGSREPTVIRFFGILQRKFWAMLRINVLQLIGNLPALAFASFGLSYLYLDLLSEQLVADFGVRTWFGFIVLTFQLITVGPVHAGFIYTLRNYAREEHVFVWHDFKKGTRENWKRASVVSLLDLAVVFLLSYTFRFYSKSAEQLGTMGIFCTVLILIMLLLYIMMHLYLYPMMVTLDLTVKQLYGNALRFAVGKILPNLVIVTLVLLFDILLVLHPLLEVFGILLVGFVIPNFLTTFYAYQGIEKHIIQKIEPAESA